MSCTEALDEALNIHVTAFEECILLLDPTSNIDQTETGQYCDEKVSRAFELWEREHFHVSSR